MSRSGGGGRGAEGMQGGEGGQGVLTHVGTVAEEVHPQLQPHPIIALIVSKLHVSHHFLNRSKSFESLSITGGLHNRLADSPETG